MSTQTVSYAIWKVMMDYMATKGRNSVYHTSNPIIYLVDIDKQIIFQNTPSGADKTDFINNIKPTSTLVSSSADAVALAIIAAGA